MKVKRKIMRSYGLFCLSCCWKRFSSVQDDIRAHMRAHMRSTMFLCRSDAHGPCEADCPMLPLPVPLSSRRLWQYCLTRLMAPGSVVHKRSSCKVIACSQKWLKDYFLFTNVAVRLLLVHNSIFKIIHSEIFCVAKDEAQERQLWYLLFTKVTARILFEKVAARLLHKSSCKIVGCLQK